jgi:hypothetical protein
MGPRRKLCDEDIKSKLICDTNSDEYIEDTESDEDEDVYNDDEQLSPPMQQQNTKWGLQSHANQTHIYQFTGGDGGKKLKETHHINKDSSHLSVFMLYFAPIIDLLVKETNKYYQQYLDRLDKTPNPVPVITNSEMFLSPAIIVQMGHNM